MSDKNIGKIKQIILKFKLLEGTNINKSFIISFLFFSGTIFYLELIYRSFTVKNFTFITILYTVFICFGLGMLLYLLSSLISQKYRTVINILLLILITGIVCVQYIYYYMFLTPMVFYSLTGTGQVLEFIDMIMMAVLSKFYVLILLLIPILVYYILSKKKILCFNTNIKIKILSLCSFIFINLVILLVLFVGGTECNSDFDVYYNTNVPELLVNRFGIFTTVKKDLINLLFSSKDVGLDKAYIIDNDDETNNVGNNTENSNSNNKNNNSTDNDNIENEEILIDTSPNIMTIDFDELIKNEKDKNISLMHQYFSNVEATNKNAHTGIFKDYNLIFITAESFSYLAVDEELTPTLYKLVNECFVFNNFYNPIWGVSTSDGEYVACQSLLPKPGCWSFYRSSENYLPFVMGRQFEKLGYPTRAYHNHYYTFYARDCSHPNMGYEYKGLGNGLEVRETWPESDVEMMEKTIPEYINDDKFHTYYMTVSGHKNYNFFGNYMAAKNKEYVKDLDYSEAVKAYIACNIELDKAMKYLLDELEKNDKLDNTVIVMSADHYPYGLQKSEIDERAGHEVENNFELYKSNLIIWANGRKKEVIDKPCSSLDIIPTISNLFGLEYDSRLLMGKDIFSDSEPLVIFANRSFITDKVKYNSITKKAEFLIDSDEETNKKYLTNIKRMVSNKFLFSKEILERNYYGKLFDE